MAERHANYRASLPEDAAPSESPRNFSSAGFRFTIGGLLALTAAAAVIAASLFAFPPIVSAMIAAVISICIPSTLLGCALYGGPSWRAFALGMLLPSLLRLFGLGPTALGGGRRNDLMMMLYMQQGRSYRAGGSPAIQAFDYFTELVEFWDRMGYAIMMDECIFWMLSAFAGSATLLVQQRFARVAAAQPRSGESA